jgi:hypothetical protein
MVAPAYADKRRDVAKKIHFGRKACGVARARLVARGSLAPPERPIPMSRLGTARLRTFAAVAQRATCGICLGCGPSFKQLEALSRQREFRPLCWRFLRGRTLQQDLNDGAVARRGSASALPDIGGLARPILASSLMSGARQFHHRSNAETPS